MMIAASLISTSISYDSVGNAVAEESSRLIQAYERSITRAEWESAGRLGLNPQIALVSRRQNYKGEKLCEVAGERFKIYRTYQKGDYVELYLEKKE